MTGCGGGGSSSDAQGSGSAGSTAGAADSSGSSASGANGTAATQKPSIQGSPPASATVGQVYSFQPQASGGAGSLSFTIANKPAWAAFNASTGQLSGTPTASDVGTDANIEISVTDGTNVVSLPPFNITVAQAPVAQGGPGTVTLSWQPPTENTDGSPLMNLAGYNIHYGTQSQDYTSTVKVSNPGLTTYVLQSLPKGTYYFAVTAYNSSGVEGEYSPEVSAAVN